MNAEPNRFFKDKTTRMLVVELGLIFFISLVVFILAARYDFLERLVVVLRQHEEWEADELISVSLFLVIALAFFSLRRWVAYRKANTVLVQRNNELQKALIQIKDLKGIIPICSACKMIRDDEGFWHQVESYIENHTHAEFTHGICPDCTAMLYPDYIADKKKRQR